MTVWGQKVVKEPQPEGMPSAARAGITTAISPTDVSVVGNSAGAAPEPSPTVTEQPSGWSTAANASLGLAEAVGTLGWEAGKFAVLNTGTLGGYSTYQFWGSIVGGYQEHGLLGAANAINPLT